MHHRTSIRQIVLSTILVVVAAAVTTGVGAWAAEVTPQTDRATAKGAETHDAPATLPGKPSNRLLAKERQRHLRAIEARQQAIEARRQREAAERRARVSRSTARSYPGDPKRIAANLMADRYGWGTDQFSCLAALWGKESGWDVHAANASGAYGIPQALPGSKMSAYGGDWRDNPVTQIEWGLAYIDDSYGTPCNAWSNFRSEGSY